MVRPYPTAVLRISGETLPGAQVVVIEIIPADLDSEGGWTASIVLQRGANEINVWAVRDRSLETGSITVPTNRRAVSLRRLSPKCLIDMPNGDGYNGYLASLMQ